MKIRYLGVGIALFSLGCFSATAKFANEGKQRQTSLDAQTIVHFQGSVYASPCVLELNTQEQYVSLGEISSRMFHRIGDRSTPVTFSVRLKDCQRGASKSFVNSAGEATQNAKRYYLTGESAVSLSIVGDPDFYNPDLVRVLGNVKGAGLRLFTKDHENLMLNQPKSSWIIKPGDNDITLNAALEATQRSVSAGNFNGVVRLKLEYL
ncbi:fimbrial protein [Providencia manganoxydans]|uniref:fimbrial protein n=1 Tax=Providencia manganoxydans TaxID=2923283 RepID=UPI0032D9F75F